MMLFLLDELTMSNLFHALRKISVRLSVVTACVLAALSAMPSAHADVIIHNISLDEFKVSYTLPSGASESNNLSAVGSTPGSTSLALPRNVPSVNVTITNAAGEVVAKGSVTDDRSYVLMPVASGYQLVNAGFYSRGAASIYPGIVIVNAMPGNYKVDLIGVNGTHGIPNAKVSTKFDTSVVNKPDAKEDRYKVVLTAPDGTKFEDTEVFVHGQFGIIHRTYNGPVSVSRVGYIRAR
jgi:hypothetical protein